MFAQVNYNADGFYCKLSEYCSGSVLANIFGHLVMSDTLKKINGHKDCHMSVSYYHGGHNEILIRGKHIDDLKEILGCVSFTLGKFYSDIDPNNPVKGQINRIKVRHIRSFLEGIYPYYEQHIKSEKDHGTLCIQHTATKDDTLMFEAERQAPVFYNDHQEFFKRGSYQSLADQEERHSKICKLFTGGCYSTTYYFSDNKRTITVVIEDKNNILEEEEKESGILKQVFNYELTQFGRMNLAKEMQKEIIDPRCFAMTPKETVRLKDFIAFAFQLNDFKPYFDPSIKQGT